FVTRRAAGLYVKKKISFDEFRGDHRVLAGGISLARSLIPRLPLCARLRSLRFKMSAVDAVRKRIHEDSKLTALLSHDVVTVIRQHLEQFSVTELLRVLISVLHLPRAMIKELNHEIDAFIKDCCSVKSEVVP